jgi:hypothetical protein
VVDAEPVGQAPPGPVEVTDTGPYSDTLTAAQFDGAHDLGRDLARANDRMIEEHAERVEMDDLRLLAVAAMLRLGRPPERIAQVLATPRRDALVTALKRLARMLREPEEAAT